MIVDKKIIKVKHSSWYMYSVEKTEHTMQILEARIVLIYLLSCNIGIVYDFECETKFEVFL